VSLFDRCGTVSPLRRCYVSSARTVAMVNVKGSLVLIALAAIICGIAIGGCGSPSKSRPNAGLSAGIKYVDCMRANGVPNLPDPGPGGSIQLGPSSEINMSSPAFKAAETTCSKLLPGGEAGALGPASKQLTEQMLAMSKCMRAHGVSGFPDPTVGPPPSNPQNYAIAMGSGGVSLLVPKTIDVSSPAFKQAAATCRFGAQLGKGQRTPAP